MQFVFFGLNVPNITIKWRLYRRALVATREGGQINIGNESKLPKHAVDSDEGVVVFIHFRRASRSRRSGTSSTCQGSRDAKAGFVECPSDLFVKLQKSKDVCVACCACACCACCVRAIMSASQHYVQQVKADACGWNGRMPLNAILNSTTVESLLAVTRRQELGWEQQAGVIENTLPSWRCRQTAQNPSSCTL